VRWLLIGLGGATVLWALSRTRQGAAVVEGATDDVLGFIDVTAERIRAVAKSRGYRNNNPGNIRYIAKNPWRGQVGDDNGYGIYSSPQEGTRALGQQLRAYERRGLRTVRDVISTWAPSNENNTAAYVNAVASGLDVAPDEVIPVSSWLAELARLIAKHENGYIDSSYRWEWAELP